jgi:starch synthase
MVASEVAPWSKTGGLADVAAALPAALAALGHHVTIVTPKYRHVVVPDGITRAASARIGTMRIDLGLHVADVSANQRVVFVDCPRYFDRDGYYGTPAGDFQDNAMRFALLATAALDMANDHGAPVDVVHAHDWQAGLVPALLSEHHDRWPALADAARVFTIHNLAYQGRFPKETVSAVGLPRQGHPPQACDSAPPCPRPRGPVGRHLPDALADTGGCAAGFSRPAPQRFPRS